MFVAVAVAVAVVVAALSIVTSNLLACDVFAAVDSSETD